VGRDNERVSEIQEKKDSERYESNQKIFFKRDASVSGEPDTQCLQNPEKVAELGTKKTQASEEHCQQCVGQSAEGEG